MRNKEFSLKQWPNISLRHQPDPTTVFFLQTFYEPVVQNETKSSINGFDFDLNNILKGIVLYKFIY